MGAIWEGLLWEGGSLCRAVPAVWKNNRFNVGGITDIVGVIADLLWR